MDALIQLIFFFTLLIAGYVFGKIAEKRHYRSIMERERQWMQIPTTSGRHILVTDREVKQVQLATGSVVISVDYFKRIVAGLRNIFGGNVQSYETLVDRARREAVLRMKESCPQADQIINLRLETSSISKGKKNQVGAVEVLAYGTAVYLSPAATDPAATATAS
ncbi:MAG: heavy metal-binding domain-containing protein [Candidatus Electrothrix sp. GW3-4]|uniref:YbjQ family protein n=1 Tax=Candidatus Electrothrix sp. GW3-4 TaxID=3126740 RepID=UPI0030D11D07